MLEKILSNIATHSDPDSAEGRALAAAFQPVADAL
jgi:hypothetical protein